MNTPQTRLLETVADIAYLAGAMRFHSGDSRADVAQFIQWSEQFEAKRHADADGNETYDGKDYMEAIEDFMADKLPKHDHTCPVCSANVHGRVTVALEHLAKVSHLRRGQLPGLNEARSELRALRNLCQPA